jgi:hypothetical protein
MPCHVLYIVCTDTMPPMFGLVCNNGFENSITETTLCCKKCDVAYGIVICWSVLDARG